MSSLAHAATVLELVELTRYDLKRNELEKIYGKLKPSKSKELIRDDNQFSLNYHEEDSFLSLQTKESITLLQLPYTNYEMGPMLKEGDDVIIGQIIAIPSRGIYLEVKPDKSIKSFNWKKPWKPNKSLSKDEMLSHFMQVELVNK